MEITTTISFVRSDIYQPTSGPQKCDCVVARCGYSSFRMSNGSNVGFKLEENMQEAVPTWTMGQEGPNQSL